MPASDCCIKHTPCSTNKDAQEVAPNKFGHSPKRPEFAHIGRLPVSYKYSTLPQSPCYVLPAACQLAARCDRSPALYGNGQLLSPPPPFPARTSFLLLSRRNGDIAVDSYLCTRHCTYGCPTFLTVVFFPLLSFFPSIPSLPTSRL